MGIVIPFLVYFSVLGYAQDLSVSLESICPQCMIEVRQQFEQQYAKKIILPKPAVNEKQLYVIIPSKESMQGMENYVLAQLNKYLLATEYGRNLINQLDVVKKNNPEIKLDFRIFHHISSATTVFSVQNYEPLWIQESREPHDLFAFYNTKKNYALLALNNYQNRQIAPYSLAHEYFHLLDDMPKNIIPVLSEIEPVVAEYRALLAELTIYQQAKKNKNPAVDMSEFKTSKFHERFLNWIDKVKYDVLFDYVLQQIYPIVLENVWNFNPKQKSIYYKIEKKTYRDFNLTQEEVVESNLYGILNQFSQKYVSSLEQGLIVHDHLLSLPYKQLGDDANLVQRNQLSQNKIRSYIASEGGLDKWITKYKITDLGKFKVNEWNTTGEGGGPKARDLGD